MKTNLFLFLSLLTAISAAAQPLNAYLGYIHNAGCDNQSGKLSVEGAGGAGNYTYLWSNGSTTDTAYNLGAGLHSVTVYSGGDSVTETVILDPFGIGTVHLQNACSGDYGGALLDDITAAYPRQFQWYQNQVLINETGPSVDSLVPGTYQYAMIDADGCMDSGSVVIGASSPQMAVFLSDSILCWGQSSQVWFTPGFTLLDGGGNTFNSTLDTFTYVNQAGDSGIPQIGMDSLGCFTNYIYPFPFIYRQPHPDPMALYLIEDTVALSPVPQLTPHPINTYTWYRNGILVIENALTYLEVATGGTYSVTCTNEYGCGNYGSLNVTFAELNQIDLEDIRLYPNPAAGCETWQLEVVDFTHTLNYKLFDSNGGMVTSGELSTPITGIEVPDNAGVYFLEIENRRFKLVSIN
ncbi:MAG: T9SS type A sorting domain-containing protein [Bacteroidota bacterium]